MVDGKLITGQNPQVSTLTLGLQSDCALFGICPRVFIALAVVALNTMRSQVHKTAAIAHSA